MFLLMKAEWKKIMKSKLSIFLLCILCGFTAFMTYRTYHEELNIYSATGARNAWTYASKDKKEISPGLPYYQEADTILHQYRGAMTQDWIDRYIGDLEALSKGYPRDELDVEMMKRSYGDDYKTFLHKAATGEYSEEELHNEMSKRDLHSSFGYANDNNKAYFTLYYKNDHVLFFYQMMMLSGANFETTEPNAVQPFMDKDIVAATLLTQAKSKTILENNVIADINLDGYSMSQQTFITSLAQKHVNQTFDSKIGNTLFLKSLEWINVIALLVIALMLSNSYALERSTKADQLIVSSVLGNRKTMLAKIFTGIAFALGVIVVQYLIVYLLSLFYVPLRDLSQLVGEQAGVEFLKVTSLLFTYKEVLLGRLVLALIAAAATAILTLALSYFTKNRFVCASAMVLLLLGVSFISLTAGITGNLFVNFCPSIMMDTKAFYSLQWGSFPFVELSGITISYRMIICVSWVIIIASLTLVMYQHSRKHCVTTR